MTKANSNQIKIYNFRSKLKIGLFVCAGGFEDRTLAFIDRLKGNEIEKALLLQYKSQREDNADNYSALRKRLHKLMSKFPGTVPVHADIPVLSSGRIKDYITTISDRLKEKTAVIDISGMTHLWAITTIHACISCGLHVRVIYTEARSYFPLKSDVKRLLKAWRDDNYDICSNYLQSAGLKHIHIIPEFGGNFRAGKQTCLMVFVGYEPNRIVKLVDDYAPGRLIVLYGRSPRAELAWRTDLSKELHKELFSRWYVRETEISTLEVAATLSKLEEEFVIIQEEYDIAIAPQCSKMQALASYLFWRRHPEIQLVFTTPVRFNPKRYSKGARLTYTFEIT